MYIGTNGVVFELIQSLRLRVEFLGGWLASIDVAVLCARNVYSLSFYGGELYSCWVFFLFIIFSIPELRKKNLGDVD